MNKSEFVEKFEQLATALFIDTREQKPQAKARVWLDICLEDIMARKYSPEAVVRAMERLIRENNGFLKISDLIDEIKEEGSVRIG